MRNIDLKKSVVLPDGVEYSVQNLLAQFVWAQDWSADEAAVASFKRIRAANTAAKDSGQLKLEERDFTPVMARLRQVQFPAHVALELSELRIEVALSPKTDD